MNNTGIDPQFEFRIFRPNFGRAVESIVASCPVEDRDQGRHTYILSATNQTYNVKIRDSKLDIKVLLRCHRGLERWRPYLQCAFPLTSAFLHEFFFAWLEVAPPPLARSHYTAEQLLEEVLIPSSQLCVVQVYKQRRHYRVNDCRTEIASLWMQRYGQDEPLTINTVAVESTNADRVLHTLDLLGLDVCDNTNYPVGLRQLLTHETPPKQRQPAHRERVTLLSKPEPVFVGYEYDRGRT